MKRNPRKKSWTLDLGATATREGVRFRVWAPRVSSLSLIIIGESGEFPMHPEDGGYFCTMVTGLKPGARYFYLLDGDRQRPDPVSRFQPEGVHGPSEVIDPGEFEWGDHAWNGIPLEEMILYELHPGTFTDKGTFESTLPHLDYLKEELGVTAIELMPVAQFPGERNWGYDGTYLYAPQNSYGGPRGLKTLINACHQKGLAVILDVVYNHLGPEGNYLGDYGPYFTGRYKTPWGSAVNFDGPECDEVRRFFVDNTLYWVTEYHVDGLRLDAIHGIYDFSARHILSDIREAVHRQARNLGRPVFVIAESDLNDVRVIDSVRRRGYALDAQWNDDFHHCLHTLLTQEQNGYYEDFGTIPHWVKALQEGFVYSGQYSTFRKRRHGNSSKHLPPCKFVVFSQNHDQVGNRLKGDRLSTRVSFEALKLAAGMVLLSPHLPLLFMGEEYGSKAPFFYFVSHSDPELIEAVRKGRKEEFSSFLWEGGIPDPQDETTFMQSKICLNLRHQVIHRLLLDFYRNLIRIRKEIPSLQHMSKKGMEVRGLEQQRVVWMLRTSPEDQTCCLFSFNDTPAEIDIPFGEGNWQKALDSSSAEWGGPGGTPPEFIRSDGSTVPILLAPWSVILYRRSDKRG
jgi:maltooligosyltrehalose trehalohydrolase